MPRPRMRVFMSVRVCACRGFTAAHSHITFPAKHMDRAKTRAHVLCPCTSSAAAEPASRPTAPIPAGVGWRQRAQATRRRRATRTKYAGRQPACGLATHTDNNSRRRITYGTIGQVPPLPVARRPNAGGDALLLEKGTENGFERGEPADMVRVQAGGPVGFVNLVRPRKLEIDLPMFDSPLLALLCWLSFAGCVRGRNNTPTKCKPGYPT